MQVDLLVVGAGPVGLLCAYLGALLGLSVHVVDRNSGPLRKGRADALNARTLQLLETAGLFDALHVLGRPCNTSSVWRQGRLVSRQSHWWTGLQGCHHRYFLMIGQPHVEALLVQRLGERSIAVARRRTVRAVDVSPAGCVAHFGDGARVAARYVIGADGARSVVRQSMGIGFPVQRPGQRWAVLDAEVDTDLLAGSEIIVFQAGTADVAWIPRENGLARFYVRTEAPHCSTASLVARINRAMAPCSVTIRRLHWQGVYSVTEAVADAFQCQGRVFLAGDACHVHAVNGGQGLNTGLADAFNLLWKLALVAHGQAAPALLQTYQAERRPVAQGVIATAAALVRCTADAQQGQHAAQYVQLIEANAGYITGMGVAYGDHPVHGRRMADVLVTEAGRLPRRLYTLLDARHPTLLVVGAPDWRFPVPAWVRRMDVAADPAWPYAGNVVLIRPDAYIAAVATTDDPRPVRQWLDSLQV